MAVPIIEPIFEVPETFMGVPSGLPVAGCRVATLGVPFDCGTHPFHIGARQGPTEVRRQSRLIRRYHPALADTDILSLMGVVVGLKLKLTRFGGAVQAFNRRLHDAQDTPALFA